MIINSQLTFFLTCKKLQNAGKEHYYENYCNSDG